MSGYLQGVDDVRSIWEKFRRRELYAIAKAEGVIFSQGAPATTLRVMLKDAGVDPYKYNLQGNPLGTGGEDVIRIPKEQLPSHKMETVEEVLDVEMLIEDVYLEEMSWADLRKWCKEHGVKKEPKDNKLSLLAKAQARLNGENPS